MYQFPLDTNKQLIVFSDLDGTLLDHDSYSWQAALPALERLRKAGIPLILTTSKTMAELSKLAHDLHNYYPCIVENGAGIGWPVEVAGEYELETLGVARSRLLEVLQPLHSDFEFRSCVQMSVEEFVQLTGLDESAAERAMQRNFSEPLIWADKADRLNVFTQEIEKQGLGLLRGGRFFHLMGRADKGIAMERVVQLWAQRASEYQTLALGDSHNDIAMLKRADIAVVVRSAHQKPPEFSGRGTQIVTEKVGPAGWNEAVLGLLDAKQIN